jgi:hypothetical protein
MVTCATAGPPRPACWGFTSVTVKSSFVSSSKSGRTSIVKLFAAWPGAKWSVPDATGL